VSVRLEFRGLFPPNFSDLYLSLSSRCRFSFVFCSDAKCRRVSGIAARVPIWTNRTPCSANSARPPAQNLYVVPERVRLRVSCLRKEPSSSVSTRLFRSVCSLGAENLRTPRRTCACVTNAMLGVDVQSFDEWTRPRNHRPVALALYIVETRTRAQEIGAVIFPQLYIEYGSSAVSGAKIEHAFCLRTTISSVVGIWLLWASSVFPRFRTP